MDSFSFGLPQCCGVPVKQLGFSHICSLFRAHLCWGGGGSVANMGFAIPEGIMDLRLIIMLLVGMS